MIEKNWKDLFVLSLCEYNVPINLIDDRELSNIVRRTVIKIENDNEESQIDDQNEYINCFRMVLDIFSKLCGLELDQKRVSLLENSTTFQK